MDPNDTIKVQVLHGDALVAAGLSATLRQEPDFSLVTTGQTTAEPASEHIHVLVTDYEHGISILNRKRSDARMRNEPAASVLIVTPRDTELEIRHALEQGARGYVLAGCRIDELVAGIRAVRAGARHVDGKAAQRLADSVASESLTAREEAVLRLVVEGLCNKAVARRLDIAVGTVKSHLKSIFQKLDAASRTEVAAIAERRGLLSLSGVPATPCAGPPGRASERPALQRPFASH